MSGRRHASALGLAALLGAAGTTHLVAPHVFDDLVPRLLRGRPRAWTLASGVAELAVAGLVAAPRTRRVGGVLAAVLLVVVFPGNVQLALDWQDEGPARRAVALGRLPLQVPLVWWAWRVGRRPAGAPGE